MVVISGTQVDQIDSPIGVETRTKFLQFPNNVTRLAQLFSSPIPVAEGSTIEVIEKVRLEFALNKPELVDIDFTWSPKKVYVGSYRYYGEENDVSTSPEREGFITATDFLISHRSRYLVVYPKTSARLVGGSMRISDCNFQLKPKLIPQPPPGVALPGFIPTQISDLFRGVYSESVSPIVAGNFSHEIQNVSLYIKPGISLIQATRTTKIAGLAVSSRETYDEGVACSANPGGGDDRVT